jgi:hypothetical protein
MAMAKARARATEIVMAKGDGGSAGISDISGNADGDGLGAPAREPMGILRRTIGGATRTHPKRAVARQRMTPGCRKAARKSGFS